MGAGTNDEMLGLYVSVPFCRAKCSFCNFASGVSSAEAIERYVMLLCEEIDGARESALRLRAEVPGTVDTIYFGGGTPSLLSAEQMARVFAALRRNFDVRSDAEITLEAAPGQIAEDALQAALKFGLNRISLGVQSFVNRESMAVGRSHTGASCAAEIARLRAAGVQDIGVDLIAGLPHQTEESWNESLLAALAAKVQHVSVYMFEIDDDSRLGREVLSGGSRLYALQVPDEDRVARFYEHACAVLPVNGFAQYEISNFARDGFESRHNTKYWKRKPYLGFGLDAHSMLRRDSSAVRFANPDELKRYHGRLTEKEVTSVGLREAFEEHLFLGLRMSRGVDAAALQESFPSEWVSEAGEAVNDLQEDGLMQVDKGCWRLTPRGRLVSNGVFGHLLASVPA